MGHWWDHNRLRLIQNNLRETDADLNVASLVQTLQEFSANVLMMNAGGIVAFYPTDLEYHYKSPYLKGDLLKEAVEKCHTNGMKFIARFDFSKAHETIFAKQPGWFYRTAEGKEVNYYGVVHTCINGYYQREYSLKMIDEVISRYPVDGIFFNMFGYQNWDYSGNRYGLCHCQNCQQRFAEMFGHKLPSSENPADPIYQDYLKFKTVTTQEMLDHIHNLVQSKNKDIAISTYNDHKVDIIRKESNTAVDRPYPKWLYSASENVKSVEDTWSDKLISNCCINAVDLFYRFVGVSKEEVEIRLYESIASGSGLDFCIIGVFEGYPDRDNFEIVKDIFKFHKDNEHYFGQFDSLAKVLLIKPDNQVIRDVQAEYLGIFKMLKEQHILFDVMCQKHLKNRLEDLARYQVVIVPDVRSLGNREVLAALSDTDVHVVATHLSFTQETEASVFSDLFGGKLEGVLEETRSAYLEAEDKAIFKRFANRDWMLIDGSFARVNFDESVSTHLPYRSQDRFGPPEKCGRHPKTGDFGLGIKTQDSRKRAFVPWQIGMLYYRYGYEDHKHVLVDLLEHLLPDPSPIYTNAPKNVEVFLNRYDGKNYLLQLLNLSGFNGTTYSAPNGLHDLEVTLKGAGVPVRVYDLKTKTALAFTNDGEDVRVVLERLHAYAAIVLEMM